MIPPRFEESSSSAHGHFDKNATPRWLMIPEGETGFVDLVHDPGKGVKSSNPNIASIDKSPSGSGQFRTEYSITARSAGQTFIQVVGSPVRLDVRVKVKVS